ncbi:MAG: dipeptidase [Bacteroidales bacterium]|nr:dipeptidase [Bacteroidales bacterium]
MRKIFALIMFSAFAWGAVAQTVNPKQAWKKAESRTQLTEEEAAVVANMVHEKYVSLDSHNDTAGWLNHPDGDFGVTKGQVTFPLMKEGGLDAAFFAIYLDQGPLNDFSRDSVYNYAMNEIALFKKYIAEHSDEAEIGYAPEDLKKIKKKGKRCVVFALENGYGIGKDLDKINKFYDEGVRYITLCHNYVNDICDASRYTKGYSWGGLSEFGYKVVERMNELGMIIDFSHASSSTLWDLLECSKAPVIATHSSVWELKKNNRNLKDDEIKAIAKAGGLIQLASGRFFLSDLPKKEVTIKHLADHIDYVKNLVGAEYIGLGTDFDGGGGVVGLEDCSKMKDLTKELLLRGYTPYELSLFWGGNFLRVWQKIIDVSKELKKVK